MADAVFYLVIDTLTGNIVERRQFSEGDTPRRELNRRWVKCSMEDFGNVMKTDRWDRLDEALVPIRDQTLLRDDVIDVRRKLSVGPIRERGTHTEL